MRLSDFNDIGTITDVHDERVREFHSLRVRATSADHYIIEGREPLRQALLSKDIVTKVFVAEEQVNSIQSFSVRGEEETPSVYVASKALMSEMVGYHLHQGILAVCEKRQWTGRVTSTLCLQGVQKAENVGALVRTAYAFGCERIVTDSCSPYVRRAVRVSMGAVCHCEVTELGSADGALLSYLVDQRDVSHIIAIERTENAISVYDFIPSKFVPENRPYIFIAGAEGSGVSREVLELAHATVEVPIRNLESLNVNVAVGVVLSRWSQSLA